MWWKLLLVPLGLYVAIAATLFFLQGSLLFPGAAVGGAGALPPGSERLAFETPDGVGLHGVRIRARQPGAEGRPLILGFGGNAWNGEDVALTLADLFPDHDVAAFQYRGYPPSGGRSRGADLLADAPLIHAELVRRYRPAGIVAVGFSVGTGIAAHLARERPIAGAILVTPYDSLAAVAADHYRWLPVRLLFRHEIPAAADLAATRVPVAILAAERDDLILPARTEALRRRAANLVFDRIIAGAGHNDIYQHSEFRAAMREALQRLGGQERSRPRTRPGDDVP
jgi:pimeloyl-ACP methyl ester carboxylesterase